MSGSVKSVFDTECKSLKIDASLAKKVHQYSVNFVNKNEDHIAFFGGNLLGVQTVRYLESDRNEWFDEILEADDVVLKGRLHSLPTINPKFNVSSDTFNLSCIWLMHAFANSSLPSDAKLSAIADVCMIYQFKLLTSIIAHNFKYPADKAVALATYATLSKKFALKSSGSWAALLKERTTDICAPKSIHYQTVQRMNDDASVVYMANDVQGRLREIVKKMLVVFYRIRTTTAGRITSTSAVVMVDGENIIKDKSTGFSTYKRYIHETVVTKTDFIRDKLLVIIADAMFTMPEKLLVETLGYMVDNYKQKGNTDIEQLIDETVLHAFDFISSNRSLASNETDVANLVVRLRAIYMSSRSSDPALLRMRALSEAIVSRAIISKNPSVIASVRTGVMLYIVLRTFTMRYYS